MSRLPPSFTSLYRLFLRTSAASVLHQPRATKRLRKLWRPAFDDAARVTTRLQTEPLSAANRNDLEIWLQTWHHRVDNTLAVLYTSSKTRGLSHRLTRNLGLLVQAEQHRINMQKALQWKPNLPTVSEQYLPGFQNPETKRVKVRELEDAHTWDALEEVIRMAEGRNELSFGKISLRKTRLPDPDTN
ncbi:hypothetical protein C8R44DRAFT_619110 [Mycena epipterygia]|nr:hypothetical protein C8R44DRAFT_619110 [Mycena epipterygia]